MIAWPRTRLAVRLGVGASVLVLAACNASPAAGTPSPPPGPAPAADYRSPRVEASLDRAARALRTRGYSPDGTEARAFVVQHGTQVVPASLRAGNCYVVLGVASRAITSLELELYDGEGASVARAAAADTSQGRAALRFCPTQSGGYWATVRSVEGSGLVALRRFRGPTGLALRLDDLVTDGTERP